MQFRQKEQALQQRLKETERKIQELQSTKEDQTTVILSTEQEAATRRVPAGVGGDQKRTAQRAT